LGIFQPGGANAGHLQASLMLEERKYVDRPSLESTPQLETTNNNNQIPNKSQIPLSKIVAKPAVDCGAGISHRY
jgi:hypothetical protein